jgi:hypothetical protein
MILIGMALTIGAIMTLGYLIIGEIEIGECGAVTIGE